MHTPEFVVLTLPAIAGAKTTNTITQTQRTFWLVGPFALKSSNRRTLNPKNPAAMNKSLHLNPKPKQGKSGEAGEAGGGGGGGTQVAMPFTSCGLVIGKSGALDHRRNAECRNGIECLGLRVYGAFSCSELLSSQTPPPKKKKKIALTETSSPVTCRL